MNIESLLFNLLRSEICQVEMPHEIQNLADPNLLQDLYGLSALHDMAQIVAQAIEKMNVNSNEEIVKKFQKQQMLAIYRYQKIQYELEQLCATLENAKINHIPLKGAILRNYYPEPWMRTSCDIDILIPSKDLKVAVECIVEKLNYKKGNKNFHDFSLFSESGVHLELHYDLIEEMRHPAFSNVLAKVWNYAELKKDFQHHYLLRDDFFYYYHIAHMVKHFEEGGCGIRPFLDLWILEHRLEHDASARKMLLEEGNLFTFAQAARQLADVWFSCELHNDISKQMEKYILFGGVYGNLENKISVQQSKKGGRLRYLVTKIFPPYTTLKFQFPVLQKHFYLTPVFIIVRWWKWLLQGDTRRTMQELNMNTSVSKSRVMASADLMKKLGLH